MIDEFVLLKPADEDTFEDLVTDIFMRRYKTYNFQRFGKKGQKQYGIDSIGPVDAKLIGVQSKNHPEPGAKISTSEINEEIAKSEKFTPSLDEYHIVTSASRDTVTSKHVLSVSKGRVKARKYPVHIHFWEDICHYLNDYQDLLYRYFSQNMPKAGIENLTNYQFNSDKSTKDWPLNQNDLLAVISSNLKGIPLTSPYQTTIGISSFNSVNFSGATDVQVFLDDNKADSFEMTSKTLTQLRSLLSSKNISKDLILYSQTRIAFAFLLGWIFRRVTSYRLTLVLKENQVWRTYDLPYVDPKITENLPILIDSKSQEVALILNFSRDIQESVVKHFEKTKTKPRAILGYSLEGYTINTSAQALSIALQLAQVIKNLNDRWGASRIHLFAAMPAGLATLIAYHTNAICPISLYHMDESRANYILSGEIRNNL